MTRISHRTRLALSLVALCLVAEQAQANEKVEYNRDIRPILTNACFRCHGPAVRKGGFRLDVREEATKPAKSGKTPLVGGRPEISEVIRRINAADKEEVMPPPASPHQLKAGQKELLAKWVQEGAVYQKHWSFEPPVKVALPKVDGLRGHNFIDEFIASRLQRDRLKMAPEADRRTLIRRVAFAVTGLPPTLQEVEAYVNDTAPQAYEKMVDRYLASPHYGEEMARHWLDLARYADTHGLHLDNERQMWPYRDWVVRAFNVNLPFDRFTTEQIAGDLLPNPTRDQLIATGFNRCNVTTGEGGSIDSEWIFRYAVDRTNTLTETWMGMTAGCAVCHDHKFDPISAKEYYSLYAFFYSAAGPAMDGNSLLTDPFMKLASPAQEKQLAEYAAQIAKAKEALAEKIKTQQYHDPGDLAAQFPELAPKAGDPQYSFQVWRKQGGGKDAKLLPQDIKNILKEAKPSPANEKKLRDYYVQSICLATRPAFDAMTKQIAELTKTRDALDRSIPGTFIFKQLAQQRPAFLMERGQYDKPGMKVEPDTPRALPPLTAANPKAPATRLDLARWLVSSEHPLTARVAVNRYWQQFFGTGIVQSASDFGAQGQLPSHPELLDYLAIWFRENDWDVKALTRLMLTSATFRQSSKLTPELLRADADNRFYARGPRFRLDAEQIRDNALYVGGLLNLEMGGRGVRPYQPPRIWEPVAFAGSNTQNYTQDKGSALYRRTLYTFIKRTAPAPAMVNFDAPNRESSCARRERSNTPLQALQLMNDVQHFEAARKLAERVLVEGGKTSKERIDFAYRLVLSRPPEAMELAIVEKTLDRHLERYQKDVEAARKLIRVGESPVRVGLAEPELAAYTMVANLLLNLDETLTRN